MPKRSDFDQDTYLYKLALASPKQLHQDFVDHNEDLFALATTYRVPAKELLDRLIGMDWFLCDHDYLKKQKIAYEHRGDLLPKYFQQILDLRQLHIPEHEAKHRHQVVYDLLEQGRSSLIINRLLTGKPFPSTYANTSPNATPHRNYAQEAIARIKNVHHEEYDRIFNVRLKLFDPYYMKLSDLLNELATYMTRIYIARYMGWSLKVTSRHLQHFGIVPVEGYCGSNIVNNPNRIGGGRWDYMIGRSWRGGQLKVLYPLGYRKVGHDGYVKVCMAEPSEDLFTDNFNLIRNHLVYYRVKCNACGYEMNLHHQYIVKNGGCPVCLKFKKAKESGVRPNLEALGYKERERTLLATPIIDESMVDSEDKEYNQFMEEALTSA